MFGSGLSLVTLVLRRGPPPPQLYTLGVSGSLLSSDQPHFTPLSPSGPTSPALLNTELILFHHHPRVWPQMPSDKGHPVPTSAAIPHLSSPSLSPPGLLCPRVPLTWGGPIPPDPRCPMLASSCISGSCQELYLFSRETLTDPRPEGLAATSRPTQEGRMSGTS